MPDVSSLTPDIVVQRRPEILSQDVETDAVLLDPATGAYYGLTPISRRIWELIERPTTIRSICEALLLEYSISYEVCEKDVTEFVEEMRAAALIETKSV